MHTIKTISILLVFLVISLTSYSQQTIRTYYVGHSLSDQIPDMVKSLSDDDSTTNFWWVYQGIPGAPLHWQWARKAAQDYYPIHPHYYGFYDNTYGLSSGNFDVLVLTEAVPRYASIINETYQYADSFYTYAKAYNNNVKVFLYEDWHCLWSGTPTGCSYDVNSNPWRQRLTDDLPMWESVIDTLNNRFNPADPVCLIPAGQGLAAMYDSIQVGAIPGITNITGLFSDEIHLNDTGKYYVACIHYAMIHRKSPVGLTNQLQVWWGGNFDAPSPAQALKFQEMAWEVVNRYPKTCVNGNVTTIEEETHLQKDIHLYPNPATDELHLTYSGPTLDFTIFNPVGQVVKTGRSKDIDIQDLDAGIYMINIDGQIKRFVCY